MPTYRYQCNACSAPRRLSLPMAEASETATCPECGAEMSRIWTFPAINWNGNRALDNIHPEVQSLIDNRDRNEAEYWKMKEAVHGD